MDNNLDIDDNISQDSLQSQNIIRYTSFDDMNIDLQILRGVFAYGFEKPSGIQQLAIKPIIDGHDVIAQAQSGTGKTAAFIISALSKIDKRLFEPQIIIMAPTRELASQIYDNAVAFNTYTKFSISLLIGGADNQSDNKIPFKEDTQIVIGTPGKIYYMLSKYILKSNNIKMMVLDEADEMLSAGFKDQVYDIFQFIPNTTQICIFSATMNADAIEMTTKFMNNPLKILVKNEELTLDGIEQYYVNLDDELYKFDTLIDLYRYLSIHQTIIYVNSKKKAQYIHSRLTANNFTVSSIHSDMTQSERNLTIKKFRLGEIRILLATDIIARGLDVQQVSIVINYDLPLKKEVYIHRIGRSGRYGRKGIAINFVTKNDFSYLKQIQSFYNTNIEPLPEPGTLKF
jgi:translation initiation factor 4A